MFGNMFSGMFKPGNPTPGYGEGMFPDAIGQAEMGAPNAFGQGMPGGFDRNKLAMMLMQGMGGIGAGMMRGQRPQLRNVYQKHGSPSSDAVVQS